MPSSSQPVSRWTPGNPRGHSRGSANTNGGGNVFNFNNVDDKSFSTYKGVRRANLGRAMKNAIPINRA